MLEKIAIIEDDPGIRTVLRLAVKGFAAVCEADRGDEAAAAPLAEPASALPSSSTSPSSTVARFRSVPRRDKERRSLSPSENEAAAAAAGEDSLAQVGGRSAFML